MISAVEDRGAAFGACRILRKGDSPLQPVLLVLPEDCLEELEIREDLFDDFVLPTATPKRSRRASRTSFGGPGVGSSTI